MPPGLIEQQCAVAACRDASRDFREVEVHRFDVAGGQNQTGGGPLGGADGAEDVGGFGALVVRRRWSLAALGPAAADFVLLPDARLVAEPNLYRAAVDALFARDCVQALG